LQLAKWLALRANDVGLESACGEATICHKAHIALHSSKNQPFSLKSVCMEPDRMEMKRHQDEMSDPQLASDKRLQKRRRHPTVFCPALQL
jgi:hypothetical protein